MDANKTSIENLLIDLNARQEAFNQTFSLAMDSKKNLSHDEIIEKQLNIFDNIRRYYGKTVPFEE